MGYFVCRDCEGRSPDGRYLLRAYFLENAGADVVFRDHPPKCHYQFINTTDNSILWERHQPDHEGPPCEMIVTDDAWSIVHTGSFEREIIAFSPSGQEVIRAFPFTYGFSFNAHPICAAPNRVFWHTQAINTTSYGPAWASSSLWSFPVAEGRRLFSWRTWMGDRLVFDLDQAIRISAGEQGDPVIAAAIVEAEIHAARALLSRLTPRIPEIQQWIHARISRNRSYSGPSFSPIEIDHLNAAIYTVALHKMRDCIPLLLQWEALDRPSYRDTTSILDQSTRRVAQHALRLLMVEPAGYAPMHFFDEQKNRIPAPECLPDRAARFRSLRKKMSFQDVLLLLGSPDFITYEAIENGDSYLWHQRCDYDFLTPDGLFTLAIQWKDLGNGSYRIQSIKQAPSTWPTSGERDWKILGR
jgi:hypothetical protein